MKKNMIYAVIAAAAIVVIAAVYMLVIYNPGGTVVTSNDVIGAPVSAAELSQLKAIALNSTLADSVGVGSTLNGGQPNYPIAISDNALIVNGKVGVVLISADFCPYCAINRWGLVIALMRFGDFTGLKYTRSGAADVYPSSATFTFSNSSYSSSSVYFDAVETADTNGTRLGTPDALQMSLLEKYDRSGNIPFTAFGNKSILLGALASPQVLQGKNWAQIIEQLNNTNSPISQAVIGSANIFTAYICRTGLAGINNTNACQQAYVRSINGA